MERRSNDPTEKDAQIELEQMGSMVCFRHGANGFWGFYCIWSHRKVLLSIICLFVHSAL